MRELGFCHARSNGLRFWQGLAWTPDGALWAAKATGHDCGSAAQAPLPPDHPDLADDPPPF